MADLITLMRKTNEAQAVRLGLSVNRQFSDDELAANMAILAEAEAELYGAAHRKLMPFRVTITTSADVKQISVLATDACMANVRAAEIIFPDSDCEKPMAFKIKVEPVNVAQIKEAA